MTDSKYHAEKTTLQTSESYKKAIDAFRLLSETQEKTIAALNLALFTKEEMHKKQVERYLGIIDEMKKSIKDLELAVTASRKENFSLKKEVLELTRN